MPIQNRPRGAGMPAEQLTPCADDVFNNGASVCLVGDVPKHATERICQSLSAITGWKIDWHYIGGRTHIKALAPAEQSQRDIAPTKFLLVSHPEGHQWTVESGSKDHVRAAKATHLKIDPLYTGSDTDEAKRMHEATSLVQHLVDCAGTQPSVATGYLRDVLDVLKGIPVPSAPVECDEMTSMVDAAMVEMASIHPPLKRSECERLIRVALERCP